jgi:hypothetical protein
MNCTKIRLRPYIDCYSTERNSYCLQRRREPRQTLVHYKRCTKKGRDRYDSSCRHPHLVESRADDAQPEDVGEEDDQVVPDEASH